MDEYDLQPLYDHISANNARKNFIAGINKAPCGVRPEILQSWLRCMESNISPLAEALPAVNKTEIERGKKHVTGYTKHLRNTFPSYYSSIQEMLSISGACLIYIANNMDIYGRYGNQELKNRLKKLNIVLGCNLSEGNVGTNAASLSAIAQKGVWVIGAEHYKNAFQEFASFAFPVKSSHNKHFYIMLMVYKNNMTPFTACLFNLIRSIECIISGGKANTDVIVKNKLLEYNMTANDTALITANSGGIIMDINNIFEAMFKIPFDSAVNKPLISILPELEFTLGCIESGTQISMQEVSFPALQFPDNIFFIDAVPVKEYGQLLGIVITMTKKKKINKMINKMAGFNARFTFDDLLGTSEKFNSVKKMAKLIAASTSNVLITGESGTGKELFAHAIHCDSPRNNKAFITVNCAAIPRELIGSELFGYMPGAFTGANKEGAQGKFELANGGSIFLDEIGEMPMDMQTVLLRVLEDKIVTRLGGGKTINVDVRLIVATNQNLQILVKEGKFRLDLYYRLNVIRLDLVPLRERPEDIPLLVKYFIKKFSYSIGKSIENADDDAIQILQNYDWPGNVRELRNTIERGINLASGKNLTVADLPADLLMKPSYRFSQNFQESAASVIPKLHSNYESYKKDLIAQLMEKYKGNKSKVAVEAGIARTTLYRILKYK